MSDLENPDRDKARIEADVESVFLRERTAFLLRQASSSRALIN